jgi:uncharacterized protein YjbI with pentapeptide repeats
LTIAWIGALGACTTASSADSKELAAAMAADDRPAVSRGESFRGRALQGADFGGEDLRGVDFTGANLRSANFRDARVGPKLWIGAAILSTAMAAAVGAGVLIGLAVEGTRERLFSGNPDEVMVAGVVIATLAILVAITLWRGFGMAFKVAAIVYVGLVASTIMANLVWEDVEWQAVIRATLVVLALVLGIWAGVISHLMVGLFGRWSLAGMTVLGALASGQVEGGLAGIALAFSVNHFTHRVERGDLRDVGLLAFAYRLVRRSGTRFVDADLADSDFRGVDMNKCDITGATLEGALWEPGRMLPGDVASNTP